MVLSPSEMQFVSVLCEGVLVGIYGALIILVVCFLIKSNRRVSTMHRVLFGASITMFLISVGHLALLVLEASVSVRPTHSVAKALVVLSIFQFVISDLILIWRVWVVWGRSYYVAAGPFIIMVVAAGFTSANAARKDIQNFFLIVPVAAIIANTSLCTILIAGRIWYMHYHLKRVTNSPFLWRPPSSYRGAVALIVESGALYTTSQLMGLVLYYTNSAGLSIMLNMEIPIIGLVPTLIIVLVHFNIASGTKITRQFTTLVFRDSSVTSFNTPQADPATKVPDAHQQA
ncbi:hypothetical protein BDZ94DRAFT_64280 [Collybia nuda]|uniref:Uncharacterized protein n=1 Tax=Collybia nuda TaxID=64659 RepID=A0A9P5XW94_9AGAR|nr:hypothetical protein BDZ94DRAFT_64280 [Collybia nuda]